MRVSAMHDARRRLAHGLLLLGLGCLSGTALAQVPQERLDAAERQRLRWELKQRALDERLRAQREHHGSVSPQAPVAPGSVPVYPGSDGYPQAGGYPPTRGHPHAGGHAGSGGYPGAGGYPGTAAVPAAGPYPGAQPLPPAVLIVPVPGHFRPDGAPRLTPEERQVLRRQLREGQGYR